MDTTINEITTNEITINEIAIIICILLIVIILNTILGLIDQNKILIKSHYNIVYDINNIQKTISHITDDTTKQIKKHKNTHATYILEQRINMDELKNKIVQLSTNIHEIKHKLTNLENTMVTNEELTDAFNTLTRYLFEIGCITQQHVCIGETNDIGEGKNLKHDICLECII
jgi:hypothetical protein